MSNDNTPDDYEVGYRKPPKNRQFQKGVSGNPKGRPKKTLDFDSELLREVKSFVTLNDNGVRRRISKLQGIVKQLTNKAMSGNIPALRTCVAFLQQAHGRVALVAGPQPNDSGKHDFKNLTDAELMKVITDELERAEREAKRKRKHVSNTK
jgi:hypothetical protein